MSNISLFFERPGLLWLLIPALALILIPYFRLSPKRRKTFKKLAPTVLHSLCAVLLVLMLAGTAIARSSDSQAVMLVLDLSHSTQPVHQQIRDRAEELSGLFDQQTPVGIVAFGGNCVYAVDAEQITPVRTDATDISQALEYAYSKLPTHKAGRIILFSDGKQTDGDGDSTAQYLHSRGIRIDAVYFHTGMNTAEAQISSVTAPENPLAREPVVLTVELGCNSYTDATLSVYEGENRLAQTQLSLTVGSNITEIPLANQAPGPHTYSLVLEPQRDTIAENNTASVYVQVADKPSLLLIAGENAQADQLEALLRHHNHITRVAGIYAPRTLTELCNYDGVILANISSDELPKNFSQLLHTYVYSFGRSLVALGGPNTYMYGGMKDTGFEEMMPVEFSLSRSSEDDPVALMLVMDCSQSMSQQTTYMSVAKQGAIKCVDAMTVNDYVGIISFNRYATVEAPLEKNTQQNKDKLNRIISGLITSQGTYYTDALTLAHEQLKLSDATVKHILFVSDGSPADTAYKDLLPQIAADGISISTIGLGYSSTLLENMAEQTGGQYYYVTEASELPDIMLTLTKQISVNSLITGQFSCAVTADDELSKGLASTAFPAVGGYLGTTAKKGATVQMTVGEEKHPLLASWEYGAGNVTCFTSDLTGSWCQEWLNHQPCQQAVQKITDYSMPKTHRDSSLTAKITLQGKSADITVHTATQDESKLTVTMGQSTYTMAAIQPGVYQVTVDITTGQICPITVTQADQKGKILDTLQTDILLSSSKEYDAFAQDGQALLTSICSHSGGIVTEDLQALANVRVEAISVVFDFMLPFGIMVVIFLLADVAIRKLRWKDIKNYWLILKNAKK